MAAYVSGDFCSIYCTNNSVNIRPVILTIQQVVVKGYHECPFSVEVGERFIAQKKRGDRRNVLKVVNTIHDRGQLGHLQRELVAERVGTFSFQFVFC